MENIDITIHVLKNIILIKREKIHEGNVKYNNNSPDNKQYQNILG